MNALTRYIALACVAAGAGCLLLGAFLMYKAFTVDALSSYGYGLFGLIVLGLGAGLVVAYKALSKTN